MESKIQNKEMKLTKVIKRPVVAAATVMLLAACNQSYPGLEFDYPENEIENNETYNKTPLMVFVSEQDFFSITATRGMGPFDNDEHFSEKKQNAVFYLYAFRNGKEAQGQLTSPADLTKTRYTEGKSHDDDNESCLLDGPDYNYGMPTKLQGEGGELKKTWNGEERLFYSSKYQDVGYNFFAYFIDDCQPTINRSKDKITYEFDVDGTQDVLFGMAPPLTLDKLNTSYSKLGLSADDKAKIVNANGYSTFAAHREVHPSIDLDHVMARFIFQAYPGDETAKDIKITKIRMQANSRCRMTVAAQTQEEAGVEFVENNKAWMILRDKAEDGLSMKDGIDPVTVNFEPWMSDEQWYNRTYEVIGSSLLLAPDSVYKLVLEYSQLVDMGGTEKQWRAMSSEYTIRAPKNYEYNYDEKTGSYIYKPGYQYTVKIAVFGLSEIKVSANISNWEIVDAPIIINPDDADKENVN